MHSRERLLKTIGHCEPDRVPVRLSLLYPWQQTDESYREFREWNARRGDHAVSWFPPTGLFCTPPGFLPVRKRKEPDGGLVTEVETPKGNLTSYHPAAGSAKKPKRLMSSAEDAEKFLSIPDTSFEVDCSGFFEISRRYKGEALIAVRLDDPICWVAGQFDVEEFAVLSLSDEKMILDMLESVAAREYRFLESMLRQGVKDIFLFSGAEFAIPPLVSPRHFDLYVARFNSRLYDLVRQYGGLVETHCHGRVNDFLEAFADMGSDLLNPLEPPPLGDVVLGEAKRRVGDRMTLCGNIQLDDVERGTPDHVRRLVTRAIREAGPGGGFILTLCAALYRRPLPKQCLENLKVIMETVNDVGTYPH